MTDGGARLTLSITLTRSGCSVSRCKLSEDMKGGSDCLTLAYVACNRAPESFTFYPESTTLAGGPESSSFFRARSSLSDGEGSGAASFEEARKAVRLSIGAVTVLNQWQTVLTTAIADADILDLTFDSKPDELCVQEGSLKSLLGKKSLTMEEAQNIKNMMKTDNTFVHEGTLEKGVGGNGGTEGGGDDDDIKRILRECTEMEAAISKEIEAEVMGKATTPADVTKERGSDSRRTSVSDIIKDMNSRMSVSETSTLPNPKPPPQNKPPPPPPRVRRSSSAAYTFTASEDWQVSLAEGEECEILKAEDDGWTKIRKAGGVEGFVPSDYLTG